MVKTADDERVLGCLMRAGALQPISDRWRRIRQGVENYLFALLHKYGIIFANHACKFFFYLTKTQEDGPLFQTLVPLSGCSAFYRSRINQLIGRIAFIFFP